jgi:hypothetical protein
MAAQLTYGTKQMKQVANAIALVVCDRPSDEP